MARITKLRDDVFKGAHPNGIDEGFTIEADVVPVKPMIGFAYKFGRLVTSDVTGVIYQSEYTCVFKTRNSTYIVESQCSVSE